MITIYAGPGHIFGRKCAQHGIIPFLWRGFQPGQRLLHIIKAPDSGQYRQHPRLIQRVLETLDLGQRPAKWRSTVIQQLPAGVGLHHRDPNSLRLTAAVKVHALAGASGGIFSMLIIIRRIDGEHHLLHDPTVQDPPRQFRRMRAKANVPHHTSFFHLQQIVQHAVFLILFPVSGRIQAVDHAKVNVIGVKLGQLPVYLPFYLVQVCGPPIFPGFIVRPEMDLVKQLASHRGKGQPRIAEGFRPGGGKIHIVDSMFTGIAQCFHCFLLWCFIDGPGSNADHTDLVFCSGMNSIFHSDTSLVSLQTLL